MVILLRFLNRPKTMNVIIIIIRNLSVLVFAEHQHFSVALYSNFAIFLIMRIEKCVTFYI